MPSNYQFIVSPEGQSIQTAHMRQPAIIVSSKPSTWGSCRIITPNLTKAYSLAYEKANFFSFTADMQSSVDFFALALEIKSLKPSALIFIDHFPHPMRLIKALDALNAIPQKSPIIFHVYGDFTLYPSEWLNIESFLKGRPVLFVAASSRSRSLISKFVGKNNKITSRCPFPVSTGQYFYDLTVRNEERTRLQLEQDDFLLVYAGRISLQKNVNDVIKCFYELAEKNSKLKLIIAGNYDDIGAPFFGIRGKLGEIRKEMLELIERGNESLGRVAVTYVGSLNSKELVRLYNAADLYTSLSTYHDEDYGMAPVEALFCGCPALLSSWGGYADFDIGDNNCKTVAVKASSKGLEINVKSYLRELSAFIEKSKLDLENRDKRSEAYSQIFSIEYVVNVVSKYVDMSMPEFKGFTKLSRVYEKRFLEYRHGAPLYPEGPRKKELYYEIYSSYLGDT